MSSSFGRLMAALACGALLTAVAARVYAADAAPAADAIDGKVGPMSNAFALDLYAHLAAGKQGNAFLSPTSVQAAMAMTWIGARGATAEEMARSLHLEGPDAANQLGAFLRRLNESGGERKYELSVANSLWGMKGYPFLPGYIRQVEVQFGGHVAELDFAAAPDAARQTINEQVASQTHGRIKDLMPEGSVTAQTRLVLTNAIYFKGKWDLPFAKSQTRDADFTTADGHAAKAPFMTQQASLQYAEDDGVQVAELPYGQGELAMRVFLPKSADGLAAIEKGLTDKRLTDLASRMTPQQVRIVLPRFKVETGYELSDTLQAMGMRRAFHAGEADFSGMASAERLSISLVVHKAFVQVDEEGTEAAAATGVGMRATAIQAQHEPKLFRADHPFLFTIFHRPTGAILFMGRLSVP